jgi:signal transduction histidine kinase
MVLVHPDDYERTMDAMRGHIYGSYEKYEVEYRILNKSGEYIWFYDIGSVVKRDSNGHPLVITGLVANISERKQTELIINQQTNELIKLNSDKDRFISIMSHDLKSPFSGILGLADFLMKNFPRLERVKILETVKQINKSARNTFELLEDILLWAKNQQGRIPFYPQLLSLRTICTDALEVLQSNASAKQINIKSDFSDQITVFADPEMLKTVLRNLVSNAIKFTNTGGIIKINVQQINSIAEIAISDNGVGIKPSELKKLFDISQVISKTGTAEESGTGLGLLICKDFIEKHGGRIWVESESGSGSDFKFTLPFPGEHSL